MSDKNREQKQYDHRLRRLIQTTGDLDLATRHGVPRSTARGWLKQTKTDVVSIDVLDMDAEFVLTKHRGKSGAYIRKRLNVFVERAGLCRWPRITHNLRASR